VPLPETEGLPSTNLLVVLWKKDLQWFVDSLPQLHEREDKVGAPVQARSSCVVENKWPTLKSSLLTSFTVRGVDISFSKTFWPEDVRYADIYAFMQSDVDRLKTINRYGLKGTALSVLSDMFTIKDADIQLADEIGSFVGSTISIVAIATFIPEIIALDTNSVIQAEQAIKFLIRVAKRLQEHPSCPHPVRTVELVCGSLVDEIWPAIDKTDKYGTSLTYGANLLPSCSAMGRLYKVLKKLAPECYKEPNDEALVTLALELEPGPFYNLGTLAQMERLCLLLDRDSQRNGNVGRAVGFNLDIAHWAFLAKIAPAEVFQSPVFQRIVHAHISDHQKGHLCDHVPLTYHSIEEFSPWLDLLETRAKANNRPGWPRFSGFVATEIEACRNSEFVKKATAFSTNF